MQFLKKYNLAEMNFNLHKISIMSFDPFSKWKFQKIWAASWVTLSCLIHLFEAANQTPLHGTSYQKAVNMSHST